MEAPLLYAKIFGVVVVVVVIKLSFWGVEIFFLFSELVVIVIVLFLLFPAHIPGFC